MPARLVPLSAAKSLVPVITVQRPVLLVGRHPDCDARIDLPEISRRHCCLAEAYERLLIRDLGSLNGTRVNGQRIEEAELHSGDEVAIAQVIYRVEADPDARPSPRTENKPETKPLAPPSSSPAPPPVPARNHPAPDDEEDDVILVPLDDDD